MAKENVKCPYGCELQSETKIICALISGKNVPCEDRDRTDCSLKDILLNLQAKEQELQELTERLERTEEDLKEECTRCAAINRLEEQIETLQAENEKLKKVIYRINESLDKTCKKCSLEDVTSVYCKGCGLINVLSIIKQAKEGE